jgi:hypothetical protein
MNLKLIRSMVMVSLFWVTGAARAQVPASIEFTQRELEAVVVLLRPELNALEFTGQKGKFYPAPFLRALGVDPIEFDLDYRGLSELANIQFHQLRASSPRVRFEAGHFLIEVPIQDQSRAVRSVLGSLSVKGATMIARLKWRTRTDGQRELVVGSTEIKGRLTGTGLLKPSFMINLVKKLLSRTLEQTVNRILTRAQVVGAIQSGLGSWAKYSTGTEYRTVLPHSLEFFDSGSTSGLRYQVE